MRGAIGSRAFVPMIAPDSLQRPIASMWLVHGGHGGSIASRFDSPTVADHLDTQRRVRLVRGIVVEVDRAVILPGGRESISIERQTVNVEPARRATVPPSASHSGRTCRR
jgi:hypothetical protein